MSFLNFIKNNINHINNYTQPSIHWREGRFANPVGKAEATNGDFAKVVRNLPTELSREDVVRFFREDLYKGFVATIMWGGISRFQAEGIARNNDRNSAIPKLERLVALLRDSETDIERIEDAIASLKRGGENYFYGIGPSFFTKLLYFLSFDLELEIRPLIYDENLKPVHFALMPEHKQNPFYYYVPVEGKMNFAEFTSFEDIYVPYCVALCETAKELSVDVTNLESWLFGWPVNIKKEQPNPREIARVEVERMSMTGFVRFQCGIEDLSDAIGVSRILYDNGMADTLPEASTTIGQDQEHPIIITESENYVHLEYAFAEALLNLKRLSFKLAKQSFNESNGRFIDKLVFKVWPADAENKQAKKNSSSEEYVMYFDITASYQSI